MREWLKNKKERILDWWYDCDFKSLFHFCFTFELTDFCIIIKVLKLELSFNLELPNFQEHYGYNFGCISKEISKNKTFESQLTFHSGFKTGIDFNYLIHTDHGGVRLNLFLLGLELAFTIYDYRHWDLEKNQWCC